MSKANNGEFYGVGAIIWESDGLLQVAACWPQLKLYPIYLGLMLAK